MRVTAVEGNGARNGRAGGNGNNGGNGRNAAPVRVVRSEPAGAEELAAGVRRQLELLGEDPQREGLLRTPERVSAALRFLTRGYGQDARTVAGSALFAEAHENMVLVRDIDFYSLCEHHVLPFFGKVHVAYLPHGRVLGLSKVPRIIEVFARRLQVQERLTEQIADALQEVLDPHGVGVVIEAQHLCMMMRGVEKQGAATVTSALRGAFTKGPARAEFLQAVHSRR